MAIAFDAAASSSNSGGITSSLTYTHVCTGANLVLVVGVQADSSVDPTGVTYNGISMVKANSSAVSGLLSSIWYLVNPTIGTNSVVVTFAAAHWMVSGSMSFTGCNTSSPLDNSAVNNGSSSTPSTSITTNNAGSVLIDSLFNNNNPTSTANSPQTSEYNIFNTSDGFRGMGSWKLTTTAGSYSMGWDNGGVSELWTSAVVAINALATASSNSSFFMAASR